MQSQAYNQAVKSTAAAAIAKLNALSVTGATLKQANKDLLALVTELQADVRTAERLTGKNMWKVCQELATLAPARSWDAFNQRVEEVLNNWASLVVAADQIIAAFEAEKAPLVIGDEVVTDRGQMAKVVGFNHHDKGVKIEFADGSGKTTTDAANLSAIGEPLVYVVVYFKGSEKGSKGPAVGMKHGSYVKDMEAGIVEAMTQFDVEDVQRVFVSDVEVSCKEFIAHVYHMAKIESLLKAEGVDFMDEAKAVITLSETVLPTKNIKLYREELAARKHDTHPVVDLDKVSASVLSSLAKLEALAARP